MLGHYLTFNGNCAEAIAIYEKALDAKTVELRTYSEIPPNPDFPIPDSMKDNILYARLQVEGTDLMCSDSSEHCDSGDNMLACITTKDAALVRRAWDVLSEDAQIFMNLAPTFFAELHGSLRDKFGINWM